MIGINHDPIRLLLVAPLAALLCCAATADDKPSEKLNGWQRLFRKHAAEYKITVQEDSAAAGDVQLVAEPILHWSQPVRGGADGAIFVWVREGSPVAIGALFIWPHQDGRQGVSHELHSLSQLPLVGKWRDRTWTPPKDSVVWKPVPNAPVPAATAEKRLRQMRDLTRQFSAESHDKDDRKWDLRLLPHSLYRYGVDRSRESQAADVDALDGALFGFVEGTDLEIVLSVRAARTPEGSRWEYSLARMSDFRLAVKLADTVVWEVDPSGFDNPRQSYHCSTVEFRTSGDDQ